MSHEPTESHRPSDSDLIRRMKPTVNADGDFVITPEFVGAVWDWWDRLDSDDRTYLRQVMLVNMPLRPDATRRSAPPLTRRRTQP